LHEPTILASRPRPQHRRCWQLGDPHRHAFATSFGLAQSDPREFWVGEQTERDEAIACGGPPTGQVVAADPEIVLGHGGKLWAAGAFADRPDVRRTRLESVVDLHITSLVESHADGVEYNPRRIGSSTRGDEDVAAFEEALALGRPHAQAHALAGPALDFE